MITELSSQYNTFKEIIYHFSEMETIELPSFIHDYETRSVGWAMIRAL